MVKLGRVSHNMYSFQQQKNLTNERPYICASWRPLLTNFKTPKQHNSNKYNSKTTIQSKLDLLCNPLTSKDRTHYKLLIHFLSITTAHKRRISSLNIYNLNIYPTNKPTNSESSIRLQPYSLH